MLAVDLRLSRKVRIVGIRKFSSDLKSLDGEKDITRLTILLRTDGTNHLFAGACDIRLEFGQNIVIQHGVTTAESHAHECFARLLVLQDP